MRRGSSSGDVYSFAIILQEVILRRAPYCMLSLQPAGEPILLYPLWIHAMKITRSSFFRSISHTCSQSWRCSIARLELRLYYTLAKWMNISIRRRYQIYKCLVKRVDTKDEKKEKVNKVINVSSSTFKPIVYLFISQPFPFFHSPIGLSWLLKREIPHQIFGCAQQICPVSRGEPEPTKWSCKMLDYNSLYSKRTPFFQCYVGNLETE